MKTYPILNDEGGLYAFEVPLAYVTKSALEQVLSRVGGVTGLRRPDRAARGEGARIEFMCDGTEYVVWEPYGDSSRYWIGPRSEADEHAGHISAIERALREYEPPLIRRWIGAVLSLDFKSLFGSG